MRVFNLEIVVVALMIPTILIIWLSDTWMAFEKSLGHIFEICSCLVGYVASVTSVIWQSRHSHGGTGLRVKPQGNPLFSGLSRPG
jgi:hypothetical protein